jgi:glycosyltransferase involved in cell wall biosynthesis
MPTVSVVVAAWNAEATLERAVRSALGQTLREVEVIVVDDASADGTAGLAARLAEEDPRVRLVRLGRNGGPAAARNAGLDAASGCWVALLDADDAFAPARLAGLLAKARADGADMIADNLLLVEDGRAPRPMIPEPFAHEVVTLERFLLGNLPDPRHPRIGYGFLKPVLRRRFLERHRLRYDAGARFAEDFGFYARCLAAGARFLLVPGAWYEYRIHPGSLTANHSIEDLRRLQAMDDDLGRRIAAIGDAAAAAALRRHRRSIDQRLFWRVFIEDVKRRAPAAALATLSRSPHVCAYILRQCLAVALDRSRRRLLASGT